MSKFTFEFDSEEYVAFEMKVGHYEVSKKLLKIISDSGHCTETRARLIPGRGFEVFYHYADGEIEHVKYLWNWDRFSYHII